MLTRTNEQRAFAPARAARPRIARANPLRRAAVRSLLESKPPPRLVFEYVASLGLMVSYQVSSTPTNQEWDAYMNAIAEVLPSHELRFLAIAEGGYPSHAQRGRMRSCIPNAHRMAVVTNHAAVRFVVSAAALNNPNIKSFSIEELQQAFVHLALSEDKNSAIDNLLRRLRARLGGMGQATV